MFLNQKGMSLIEVSVAILILGITTLPLMHMYREGSIQAAAAGEIISALNLARAVVEEIKSIPDNQLGLSKGASENTVTLEQGASDIDGFYNNFSIAICHGTGSGQIKKVTGYNGAPRRAVLDSDWFVIPDATSSYLLYRYCPGNYRYEISMKNGQSGLKTIGVTVYYTVKGQERQVSLTTEKLVR